MNAPADAATLLNDAFSRISTPAGVALEITIVESESRTIGWADGKPNLNNAAVSRGACVRALDGGAQGLATTTVPDAESIARLAVQAIAAAGATAKDPHRRFAAPDRRPLLSLPADTHLFSAPADAILERLSSIEKTVLQQDSRLKKVVRFSYGERRHTRAVGNTLGVRLADLSTAASFSVELLAEEGTSTETAWDYQGSRFSDRLRLEEIAAGVAEHALQSLGGKPIPTGAYPIVLAPRVGTQLLDLVANALSAEAVQKERSFFKGMLGKGVASAAVTLHDDPLLADGLASSAFDDEGVSHAALVPIRAGVLSEYFYDLRSAARDGRDSNGRGSKGGLGAPPHPSSTNLFIAAGKTAVADMLASEPRVFLLREVMGLHMADPITGEFSLGGSGYLYENGKYAGPVRGVTIAGSVGGMLKAISAVGPDLTWYGAVGAPSLLVTGLTIAGS